MSPERTVSPDNTSEFPTREYFNFPITITGSEGLRTIYYKAPHIPTPLNPENYLIKYQGRQVVGLASPQEAQWHLKRLVEFLSIKVIPNRDMAYVNLQGGRGLHNFLETNSPDYSRLVSKESFISYKRAPEGGRAIPVTRAISNRDQKALVVESCFDTGGTYAGKNGIIHDLSGESILAVCVYKKTPGQLAVENIIPAIVLDANAWYAGIGADFGSYASEQYGYDQDFGRTYEGIIVMPEALGL